VAADHIVTRCGKKADGRVGCEGAEKKMSYNPRWELEIREGQ
jgi:hypothetical protein